MLEYKDGKILIKCESCGQNNAIGVDKLQSGPICGSCKEDLLINQPVELNDTTFDSLISQTALPVLVDFWAPWCGPCRMMGPILDSYAKKAAGKAIVAKVNTDESQKVASRLGIQGIPTLIVFRSGQEAQRQVGAVPEQALDALMGL